MKVQYPSKRLICFVFYLGRVLFYYEHCGQTFVRKDSESVIDFLVKAKCPDPVFNIFIKRECCCAKHVKEYCL